MRRAYVRFAAAAVAAAAGLTLAACGSSSGPAAPAGGKSVSVLLPEVRAAVSSAQSVHMTGVVNTGSQTVNIDLSFVGNTGLAGSMSVSGASIGLLTLNGNTYIKINSAFLALAKAPAAACKIVCGKYVQLPATEAQAITGTLSMTSLINGIFGKLPTSVKKGGSIYFVPGTYQGQPVLVFKKDGYSLDVAGTGKPYPVAMTAPGGQFLSFSQWNSVTLPAAPPSKDVVNLSQLG